MLPKRMTWRIAVGTALAVLTACSSDDSSTTVEGDVPVAYVKRPNTVNMNPTDAFGFAAGGDLLIREKSSPSAPVHNVTASITQGTGDVSDPEVSYDGKKIVFALRCPSSNTSTLNSAPACTGTWDIWEYDMSGTSNLAQGSLRRLTATNTCDEVDPAYLPAGAGYVFSSNCTPSTALGRTYIALDEYEREEVINLHTMDANGGNVQRISVNQSHDRNPTVLSNGRIMFSRWDHVGGRNHFAIFQVKPDGTDMFVLYGAHSPGNSFLHPREMQPGGAYNGHVATSLMPLSGTREGGALMFIDVANYSEHNIPANNNVPAQGGQRQATTEALNFDRGISLGGRVTTPYPLWDNTNRVLVAWTPCQVTYNGFITPCANVPPDVLSQLDNDNLLNAQLAALPVQDNVPPTYGIYMFDPAAQTLRIVVSAQPGTIYTDPVAIQARTEPNPIAPTQRDSTLQAANLGILEVRSVYDTDDQGRMGNSALAAGETPIPTIAPTDPDDTRAQVADIAAIKNPVNFKNLVNNPYLTRQARFMRFTRAIPPPSGSQGLRAAIGETDFEMQQILGYAEIEPDGSFKVKVPADTPIAITALDAQGRAFQSHTNWIQVRPGETRTCDGCHSPRRGAALNSGTITGNHPNTLLVAASGETMAGTRSRLDATVMDLKADIEFTDVWSNTAIGGVTAMPDIFIRYTGNTNSGDNLTTAVPSNGVINYPEHIQPLWSRNRGSNTCTTCHNDPAILDLRDLVSGTGRLVSYQELMVGDPVIDPLTGQPVTEVRDGEIVQVLGPALVNTGASEGQAIGLARQSRLAEILFGQTLLAGADARNTHPSPPTGMVVYAQTPTPDHATLLNKGEKRLLTEWMDLGGQYYNDPFTTGANVRTVTGLSEATFEAQIQPILRATCAANCHQAQGSDVTIPGGTSFANNRYVLMGSVEGDYNATLSMVNDTCTPANSYLLNRPSTVPHPSTATSQTSAVLPVNSADFNTIRAWILTGCTP